MPNHTLPVELYAPIAVHAERGDLVRMMLASRTLHDEVERVLYRAVEIEIEIDGQKDNDVAWESFLHRLSSNSKLARHVVKLRITCTIDIDDETGPEKVFPSIAAVLRQVVNLRHLVLIFRG